MKTKLSAYTIASNCTDISDCNQGLYELEDMERLYYSDKRPPLYYESRKRKLIAKRDMFAKKAFGMPYLDAVLKYGYRKVDLGGTDTKKTATALTVTVIKSNAFKTLPQPYKRRSTTTKPRLATYTVNGTSLARAKVSHFIDKSKLLALISDFRIDNAEDFIEAIGKCFPQQIKKENDRPDEVFRSKYQLLDFSDLGVKILFRISDHNINSDNIFEDIEEAYSIALKSRKSPNTFKPNDLTVTEYVYFTENCDRHRYRLIAEELYRFLETSEWDDSFVPADRVNHSPAQGDSHLDGVEKEKTDAEATTVFISFKKDIRRSPNPVQNEHEQLLCAFSVRPWHATAITHGSNRLSGTNISDLDELRKKIDKKIREWQKAKQLDVQDFMLFVAMELRLRASLKNGKHFSYYLALYDTGEKYVLRISDHHFDASTAEPTQAKHTTALTFSNPNHESWDVFKPDIMMKATEYVYYEGNVGKDELISIAKDIVSFVETGTFTPSVKPDEIHHSPGTKQDLGHIYEEPVYIADGLSGILSGELQKTELRLLEIDKLNDFGEKIGGSAKDKRIKNENGTNESGKKNGFNRLPTEEELQELVTANNAGLYLCSRWKPDVIDFENAGLNKICARLAFFSYYGIQSKWASWNVNGYYYFMNFFSDKKRQEEVVEMFLSHKYDATAASIQSGYISFSSIIVAATVHSMALEKELKDDFSYKTVLKIFNYNKRARRYINVYLVRYGYEQRQKYFNIEYENVSKRHDTFIVCHMSSGYLCVIPYKFSHKARFLSSECMKVESVSNYENYAYETHYVDLYLKGRQMWYEAHPEDNPDNEKWEFKDKKGLFAKKRIGKDWRKGRNAETHDFIDTFHFRAVEFGESMPQKERWEHLNRTYDSFMDLCDILNIKPENISLGGVLGICFGSRGIGGKNSASAHYEPMKKVINLTRNSGAGCLGHEWFHAFDNQLTGVSGFGTEVYDSINNSLLSDCMCELNNKMTGWSLHLSFYEASKELDRMQNRKEKYWSQVKECAARSFEWYIIKKLAEKQQVNEYLAQIPPCEVGHEDTYPYPHAVDFDTLNYIFHNMFKSVKQEKTDYGFNTIR